jgi:hypothetical protein
MTGIQLQPIALPSNVTKGLDPESNRADPKRDWAASPSSQVGVPAHVAGEEQNQATQTALSAPQNT